MAKKKEAVEDVPQATVVTPARQPSAPKVAKFQKKNKSRLPRREKKAQKKAAGQMA